MVDACRGNLTFYVTPAPSLGSVWPCNLRLTIREIASPLAAQGSLSPLRLRPAVTGGATEKYNQPMRAKFPVTVHLLFFREDQVLLLRRFNTGYADGQYSVPAGHLDGGESVIAAAVREAQEETGLYINPRDILFSSVMHRMDGDEWVDFFVQIQAWHGEPTNTEPDKCDELRWFGVRELPDNVIPYVRQAIQNHHNRIQFDEFGW